MKKLILVSLAILIFTSLHAQLIPDEPVISKPNYRFGLGVQYSWPFYSLSLKYALTQHSVIEGIASPASSGIYGLSFYGARYVYRLKFYSLPFLSRVATSYPYFFAGVGSLGWSYNDGFHKYSNSVLGYYAGAGYEVILGNHFAFSGEVGYGELSALRSSAVYNITFGGGFHYYFGKTTDGSNGYQGTTVTRERKTNNRGDAMDNNTLVKGNQNVNEPSDELDDSVVEANNIPHDIGKTPVKYRVGLGIIYTAPFYGISLKYAISRHSVIEGIAAPGSTGNYGLSFYGARYIYRFPIHGGNVTSYPYLFGGAGYMQWGYNDGAYHYSGSAAAYDLGAGYQFIFADHFGVSLEGGYGQVSVSRNNTAVAFTFGGGFHYYFGRGK